MNRTDWEEVERLGEGAQSETFLVRTPERAAERERCVSFFSQHPLLPPGPSHEYLKLNKDFVDLLHAYVRPDLPSELGALKIFKIREMGNEQSALNRLQQAIAALKKSWQGTAKLMDSNQFEHWIVTEHFPRRTVEENLDLYKGKPALALKAFLSVLNAVKLLHTENIVHGDIKPANVFLKQDDDLVLGDFRILHVPYQSKRLTHTNESVGPEDYMPPWDGGLEQLQPSVDVYMLGKLLWCMVAGRLFLNRESFREPDKDLSILFPEDPHAYMINNILEKCLVDRSEKSASIADLHAMVTAYVHVIEHGGQLLNGEVPRPCHVCGLGDYKPELMQQEDPVVALRFWHQPDDAKTSTMAARIFICDRCGHVAMFKSAS